MFRDGLDYILGVRPAYDGLLIDPCIPDSWDGYKVTRKFRGATYQIEVKNPNHVQRGVASITVDGQPIEGNVIPAFDKGSLVRVVCVMG